MFCKHCGTQLGENDKFCPGCGAPMADPAPAGPSYIAPDPGNPLLAAGRSPLFLVAVICASVVTLFQFISLFITVSAMGSYMDYVNWAYSGMDASMTNTTLTFTVFFVSVALVMSVLLLIGLWMTYVSGAQDKVSGLVRGLKLVRGTLMAQMIYMIVMLALLAFALLMLALMGGFMGAAVSGSYDYYSWSDYDYYGARVAANIITMLAVVGLVIILVVGVLAVLFYLKARKAVGCAIATAQTGQMAGAPSMYLIVMCFIVGALSILSAAVSLASMAEMTVLPVLSALAAAAQAILFGAVALSWRNKVLETA